MFRHSLYFYALTAVFWFAFCFPSRDITVRWYCHIYRYACFLLFVFNFYTWSFCSKLILCVSVDSITLLEFHVHILTLCGRACDFARVHHLCEVSIPSVLHIECKCASTLLCLVKYSIFLKMRHSQVYITAIYCQFLPSKLYF